MISAKQIKCIHETILAYRMKNLYVKGSDDGDKLPLVDFLSTASEDITSGIDEIENIMDSIYLDLKDLG